MRNSCHAASILLFLSSCAASPSTAPNTQQSETQLLARSAPSDGSTVTGPVNNLQLRFTRPARLLEVTLDGPDGLSPMMITAAAETTDYQIPLPGLGAGSYRVTWSASVSGQARNGALNFTVRE